MMRDLIKDTEDAFEKVYGPDICNRFQGYREFWNRYIGQRKDNPLKHYEINSSDTNIKNFDKKYERMTLIHYGIFVDLVGIIIDFEVLIKNPYETVNEKLSYWNTVRNIYSKMGDSIYKYKSFLDCVNKILNMERAVCEEIKQLKCDLEFIMRKRDYQCHFGPLPFAEDKRGIIMKIPVILYNGKEVLSYSEISKQDHKKWPEVREQMDSDLEIIETKFNQLHQKVIELFKTYSKFEVIYPDNTKSAEGLSSMNSQTSSNSSGDFTNLV